MLPDLIVILAFHLIICPKCCHGSWTMRSCQCILQSNFITTVDYENAQLLVTYKGASLCVVFFVICCQSSIKQCQCLWSGETISWLNARWNKLCNSATNQPHAVPCKTKQEQIHPRSKQSRTNTCWMFHIMETSLTWRTHQITLHGLSFASHNKSSMFALYKSTESQDMNHQSVLENHITGTQKMIRMNDTTGKPKCPTNRAQNSSTETASRGTS